MWRPGFDYLEKHRARVFGFHRSLCVWSWHHRGQPHSPGLVFGLDTGGSVLGVAYRIAAGTRDATLDYLYGREMVTPVYAPRLVRAETAGGSVQAVTFTVDRRHDQYAGRLPFATTLAVVSGASGRSGHNRDYVLNAARSLQELAVDDAALQRLARELHRSDAAG